MIKIGGCPHFVFLIVLLAAPPFLSGETASSENMLQHIQNRLDNEKERIQAVQTINFENDPTLIAELIKVVRDDEDSIMVRAHIIERFTNSQNQWTNLELKKILSDSSLKPKVRQLALYGLWRKAPNEIKSELITLAQSVREPIELRTSALSYLGQYQDTNSFEFWNTMAKSKANPDALRISALFGMEKAAYLEQDPTAIILIIKNSRESDELRKQAILVAGRHPSLIDLQSELLNLLSKPENSLEIRRFALDNLALNLDFGILPQLKQVAAQEKNPAIAHELKRMIESLDSNPS